MYLIMPFLFLLGIIGIALEDKLKINKAAIALLMCISLWLMLMFDAHNILIERANPDFIEYIKRFNLVKLSPHEQVVRYIATHSFLPHLGRVSETLFFVMCSMLIVDIIDKHGGFHAMTGHMQTSDKRRLLWYVCLASFFFSALLDNLAASIVIIAILEKLVPDRTDRLKYACMIIISANAGGSWSPIGDVTTLLLWMGGNITAYHQMTHLFLPALVNMLVPLTIASFWLFKKGRKLRVEPLREENAFLRYIPARSRKVIFWIGIFSLASVPVFQASTNLPPFMCVLLGLVFLWFYTDIMYRKLENIKAHGRMRITKLMHNVDLSTIFFFLGILMSVAALETGGQLGLFSGFLDKNLHQPYLISFIIGVMSSFTDNVALVAATMGMYPVLEISEAVTPYMRNFLSDSGFWTFLAYSAVTGGSMLIIGSATGVTVMGLEKISFGYYFKRFSGLAFLGYITGAAVFLLMR